MAGVKLIPRYENAVAQVKRDEVKVMKNLVEALKLVEDLDPEWKPGESNKDPEGAAKTYKDKGVKACEKALAALRDGTTAYGDDLVKFKANRTSASPGAPGAPAAPAKEFGVDEKEYDRIKTKIQALLAELQKMMGDVRKVSSQMKGLEVKETSVAFKPIASAFAAKYKAECQKVKPKPEPPDPALVTALTKIDSYDEPTELVDLTKAAKKLIDKEMAEAKTKKQEGLEKFLVKLREDIKAKDTKNFFANKDLF